MSVNISRSIPVKGSGAVQLRERLSCASTTGWATKSPPASRTRLAPPEGRSSWRMATTWLKCV